MNNATPHQARYTRSLSGYMDAARWISATLVVLAHLNNRMFLPLSSIPSSGRTLGRSIWAFFNGFGHPAVVTFFVLSGFLVGGPLLRRVRQGRPLTIRKYTLDRIVRVYLVFIPALIFTGIADAIGRHYFPQSSAYRVLGDYHVTTVLANLVNLQNFVRPFFGSNGPSATLANEFWYYLTFPLLLMLLDTNRRKWIRGIGFASGVVVLVSLSLLQPFHLTGFVLWVLGAIAANLPPRKVPVMPLSIIFLLLVVGIRVGVRTHYMEGLVGAAIDIVTALTFAASIYAYRSGEETGVFLGSSLHAKIAAFSFSLYMLHVPIINLCASVSERYLHHVPMSPGTTYGWMYAWIVAVCFFTAWVIAQFTENMTPMVRKYANHALGNYLGDTR